MHHPLNSTPNSHLRKLKAIIQQYMTRMVNDKLVISED